MGFQLGDKFGPLFRGQHVVEFSNAIRDHAEQLFKFRSFGVDQGQQIVTFQMVPAQGIDEFSLHFRPLGSHLLTLGLQFGDHAVQFGLLAFSQFKFFGQPRFDPVDPVLPGSVPGRVIVMPGAPVVKGREGQAGQRHQGDTHNDKNGRFFSISFQLPLGWGG